jgi:FAD/FMN-containing dehydrogenase
MKRREFCRVTVVAGLGAALPSLPGCGGPVKTAKEADTSLRAVTLDGKEIQIEQAAIRELGESMTGPVVLSGHPQYDGARALWNGMHDRRPALIARCKSADDVGNAVTFARERSLLTAVRGGGHSWPGKSCCDDGLMIDLSEMYTVTVDPEAKRARAQGGALLHSLDTAALEHGLVTTAGVVSHTGVGGFTLGGGFGRLNRKLGLAVDNLEAVTIVTADGRIRRASATEEPELFWGVRGGGGNFGVVTEFEFRLHPFERKRLAGDIIWPIDQAKKILDFYAEWSAGLSDDLYTGPVLMKPPDGGPVIVMDVLYTGDPANGEKELAPLMKIGRPAQVTVGLHDYTDRQTMNDAMFHHGLRSYAKSLMVKEWSQGLVDALVGANDPRVFIGTHTAGGAVKRVGELDTAFPHRNAETMIVVASGWTDATQDQERIAATRAYYEALAPYQGGYYDNIEFDRSKGAENFGPAHARLAALKKQVDPMNLFRLNSNVAPAA